MSVCHLCGKSFGRPYTLKRHIDTVHAKTPRMEEEYKREDESEGEESTRSDQDSDRDSDHDEKASKVSREDSNVDEEEVEKDEQLEDNPSFRDWAREAREATEEMRKAKYEKYISEGKSQEAAREKARVKTIWAVKKHFFDNYEDFLINYAHLRDNYAHGKVVAEMEQRMEDKKVKAYKAAGRAIARYQVQFDSLLREVDSGEEDSEEEEEEHQPSELPTAQLGAQWHQFY